jgi:hypothetical protein
MMQTPILRNRKKINEDSRINVLEEKKMFQMPPSLQKKEHEKETKPRGYKSLHNSEYRQIS